LIVLVDQDKTLEEFYYPMMGIQYPVTPPFLTEHQWTVSGIETPVIGGLILLLLQCFFSFWLRSI